MERYNLDDEIYKSEIEGKSAIALNFDFKSYRDRISDLNALRCLELYLKKENKTVL